MTPLAHRIVKELTLPVKRRDREIAAFAPQLSDTHCFDISAAEPFIDDLASHMRSHGIAGERAFLPAPRTWLELAYSGSRSGYLIEEAGDAMRIRRVTFVLPTRRYYFSAACKFPLLLDMSVADVRGAILAGVHTGDWCRIHPIEIYAALSIINTPRIMGRQYHAPHRGLERALIAAQPMVGRFPLHAWTEIKLEIKAPAIDESGVEYEQHFTGRKCRHFCRKHLRVRNGQVEIVSSHWRGDPALGIKRSRYRVEPPRGRLQ